MTTSTVPAVLAALQTVLQGLDGTPTFVCGPVRQQPGDFNSVAWAGPDDVAMSGQEPLMTYRASDTQEDYSVLLQLNAWTGDGNSGLDCLTRVYTRHDALIDYLAGDSTLGELCMYAQVGEAALRPNIVGKGASVTLTLTLNVRAQRQQ